MSLRLVAYWLLLLSVAISAHVDAGEAPTEAQTQAASSTSTSTSTSVASDERSLFASETKLYVAQLTEQRNLLRQENDTLRSRQGLLLVYGVLLTLLSGYLMFRALRSTSPGDKKDEIGTSPFSASSDTTVTVRKNATITIRNSSTQQAEVEGKMQTRQAYSRTETASHTRPATRVVERREATQMTPPRAKPVVIAPELDPVAPVPTTPKPTPTRQHTANAVAPRAPLSVRIEQRSDRLDQIDVVVKPGTEKVQKTSGSATRR